MSAPPPPAPPAPVASDDAEAYRLTLNERLARRAAQAEADGVTAPRPPVGRPGRSGVTLGEGLAALAASLRTREGRETPLARHLDGLPAACGVCHQRGVIPAPADAGGMTYAPVAGASERSRGLVYCPCGWGARAARRDAREREQVAALEAQRVAAALARLTLPPEQERFALETHPLAISDDPAARAAYQDVMDWFEGWDGHRGLVLRGAYGVGKTTLAVGMMARWRAGRALAERWDGMEWTTETDLYNRLKRGFNPAAPGDTGYEDIMEHYQRVRLLAIDDLGAAFATVWRQEQVRAILDWRYNHRMPTILTTNLMTDDALMDYLTERVYWRAVACCDVITIPGLNLRDPANAPILARQRAASSAGATRGKEQRHATT